MSSYYKLFADSASKISDILTYDVDIPEEIANCKIPKITLQPLVENALYHGIKNKRGKGRIVVTGQKGKRQMCYPGGR